MTTSMVNESKSNNKGTLNFRQTHGDFDNGDQSHPCCHDDDSGNNSDETEQVKILLESLRILAKLAAMDTAEYQASLLQKRQAVSDKLADAGDNRFDEEATESPSVNVYQLQKSLDDLQHQWRLEDTPTLQLSTLIHRFHSTINNLQKDAEQREGLYEDLVQQVREANKRNSKLENALIRLHAKNQSLMAKIKQRSVEKRSLVKHVQHYAQQIQDSKKEQKQLEEQNAAFQLYNHEHYLLQQRQLLYKNKYNKNIINNTALRARSFSHSDVPLPLSENPEPLRSRGMSADTNFSDLDALDFAPATIDENSNGFPGEVNWEQQMIMLDENDDNNNDYSGLLDDISVYSGASSLVTDEGVATVRLTHPNTVDIVDSKGSTTPLGTPKGGVARSRTNSKDAESSASAFGKSLLSAWPSSTSKSKPKNAGDHNKEPPILVISFPSAAAIGLQFEKVPETEMSVVKHSDQVQLPARRKGLLTDAVLCDDQAAAVKVTLSTPFRPTLSTSVENPNSNDDDDAKNKKGFQLNWNVFGKHPTNQWDIGRDEAAGGGMDFSVGCFVVCGYEGYSDELHDRPIVGAKLVAINGDPVDRKWSIAELQNRLLKAGANNGLEGKSSSPVNGEEKKNAEDNHAPVTLSFRNVPLSKKEKKMLAKAGKELEQPGLDDACPAENSLKDYTSSLFSSMSGKNSATRFNFPKMSPGHSSPLKGGFLKSSKAIADALTGEPHHDSSLSSSASVMTKMPSFFPKSTGKGPNIAKSTSKHSIQEEEEEEIKLSSSSASSSPNSRNQIAVPLFENPLEKKHVQESKACEVQDDNANNCSASSTAKLMLFFSPQKVTGNDQQTIKTSAFSKEANHCCAIDDQHQTKKNIDAKEVVKEDKLLSPKPHPSLNAERVPSCNNESVPGVEDAGTACEPKKETTDKPSLDNGPKTREGGDGTEDTGSPSNSSDNSSTSDKFRDSMKSMGKMFSRPFGQS